MYVMTSEFKPKFDGAEEEFNRAIADLVVTVLSSVYDAMNSPNETIELHVFSKESKTLIEDILKDVKKNIEVNIDNLEVSLEQIH